jgi:hypothetical protein
MVTDDLKRVIAERASQHCECTSRNCAHQGRCNEQLGPRWGMRHIRPLSEGGLDAPENYLALCESCLDRAH